MAMETSDHIPCIVSTVDDTSKGKIFRFENYWIEHKVFYWI
jgi:hypothetical protein